MNIFFYSRKTVYCRKDCVYYTCPRRCLAQLQTLPVLEDMIVISGALDYALPMPAVPRSGDLIFLFAATWHELEELISMQDTFEGLRVILITDIKTSSKDEYKFHELQPRYIAAMDNLNIDGLGEVVARMSSSRRIAA